MRQLIVTLIFLAVFCSTAFADGGLGSMRSSYDVSKTAERLEKVLVEKGMTIFLRIKHSENADKVGIKLRPTELIVFGNPKVGAPLMQCAQTVAIDLPMKALIWQDQNGQVWLSYNDPKYLGQRHSIEQCDEIIKKIATALSKFAELATKP